MRFNETGIRSVFNDFFQAREVPSPPKVPSFGVLLTRRWESTGFLTYQSPKDSTPALGRAASTAAILHSSDSLVVSHTSDLEDLYI